MQSILSVSESWYVTIGMTLAMLSKMATTCSQTVLVASTGELVAPAQQQICIFSCIVWARIWLLTAPFIGVVTFIHTLLPMAAFGVMGSIGGICTCIIHYYHNQHRQSLSQAENGSHSHPIEIYVVDRSAW